MKIYVVGSTKNEFLPLNSIRQEFIVDTAHRGDNIDYMNPWLCEMTGLYYLWKHEHSDIVGLEHYRRYFTNIDNELLTKLEIESILKKYDIIVVRANYSHTKPCKTWLINHDKWNDMIKFLTWIQVNCGDNYFKKCIDYLDGDYHCLGNMFIARKSLLNEYCSYIFPLVIGYMKCEVAYGRDLPSRICGYFTEFLFGAWLEYTGRKMYFSNWKKVK